VSRLIDISLPLGSDLLTWPGDPAIEVAPRQRIAEGGAANVSELRIGTHTGTHVDPPVHFVEGGVGIDRMDLDVMVGDAVVVDARRLDGALGPQELESLEIPDGARRVLVRSRNSDLWRSARASFPSSYVSLSVEGARWIVDRGIRLVGVDFLSVEQKGTPGHPTHHTLLENGVIVVEGLDLGTVDPGSYRLIVLPLKIVDGDGGPARAVLIED
jgi:arylformamidase